MSKEKTFSWIYIYFKKTEVLIRDVIAQNSVGLGTCINKKPRIQSERCLQWFKTNNHVTDFVLENIAKICLSLSISGNISSHYFSPLAPLIGGNGGVTPVFYTKSSQHASWLSFFKSNNVFFITFVSSCTRCVRSYSPI